jgi:hypothetical protein
MVVPSAGPTRGGGYQVVVGGELDRRLEYLFEPLRLERAAGRTVLSGSVIDQAQLYGIIHRLEELGLELVSVEQVGERC